MEGRRPWSETQLAWGPERDSLEKRGRDWAKTACGWGTQGRLRGAEPRAWDTADFQRLIYLQPNEGQGLLALTTRGPWQAREGLWRHLPSGCAGGLGLPAGKFLGSLEIQRAPGPVLRGASRKGVSGSRSAGHARCQEGS